jgi:hypothetical protein
MNDRQFDALLEELRGIKHALNENLGNINDSLFMVVQALNIMEQSFCRANKIPSDEELTEEAHRAIAESL